MRGMRGWDCMLHEKDLHWSLLSHSKVQGDALALKCCDIHVDLVGVISSYLYIFKMRDPELFHSCLVG